MTKGQHVTYTSGWGFLFSAVIRRAHRDGSSTIIVHFPIRDGKEDTCCFQGDRFRVSNKMLKATS